MKENKIQWNGGDGGGGGKCGGRKDEDEVYVMDIIN